jgi:carboxyl-terminal processing protease
MDIVNRYMHGEFFNADSIKQNKELVFHTVNGREVYGGGGIMPDIFVPRDTTGVTSYFNNVANEGLLYQYAFDYTDKYRDKLSTAKDVESLLSILEPNTLLNSFVQYAAQKGIRPRPVYINISRKLIVNTLQAYIARNILGEEAFYKLLLRDDETLRKARDIVNKGEGYPELPAENQVPR